MIRTRFGLGGSRPWSTTNGHGRAAAVEETPAAGILVADSDVRDILDRYDRHLDELSERERDGVERRREFRERSDELIETVIRPVLEAVGREALERRHVWTVEERIDIQGQPAIACLFRPREASPTTGSASELTFRCLFPDRLSATAVVRRGESLHEFPPRVHGAEQVTAELVQSEVARFMEAVLEPA